MAKRVQSEAEKEYKKQRERVLRIIKEGSKEGFIFPEDLVPDLPKRYTKKQVEKLKRIKPSTLYAQAQFLDVSTGELIPANEAIERHIAQKPVSKRKSKQSQKISQLKVPSISESDSPYYPTISPIEKVQEKLEDLVNYYNLEELQNRLPTLERKAYAIFPIENRKNTLISIFEDTIARNEDNLDALEEYLNKHAVEINDLLDRIEYESDQDGSKTERSFVRLGSILNQGSLSGFQAEDFSWYSEIVNTYEES